MSAGFGRVVVDGVETNDPYASRVENLSAFGVISDTGPTYRIERVIAQGKPRWSVSREESDSVHLVGSVAREGSVLNHYYVFRRDGNWLSGGKQNVFINAVFGLID